MHNTSTVTFISTCNEENHIVGCVILLKSTCNIFHKMTSK